MSGTKGFQSPTQVAKQAYDGVKSDVFALGVTLFMLVTGMSPFNEANEKSKLYRYIISNEHDKYFKLVQKYSMMEFSQELKDLLKIMLDPSEDTRATMS